MNASASYCIKQENSLAYASCYFTCEGTTSVSATVTEWWNEWRSVEGQAYCDGVLRATCAGHGDCTASSVGSTSGSGYCTGSMSGGTGFRISCNSSGSSALISYSNGIATGEICSDGACRPVEPICIEGEKVICGIGIAEDTLLGLYNSPQLL